MRKPIIAANWKMNKGPRDTEDFLNTFSGKLDNLTDEADIVVAPPFVSLAAAVNALSSNSSVSIAAQNVSEQDSGAFTGEVNTMMLKELYVRYVIRPGYFRTVHDRGRWEYRTERVRARGHLRRY